MDFSTQTLVNTAFNAAGYVLVSVLSIAIFALFRRNPAGVDSHEPDLESSTVERENHPTPNKTVNGRIEFISFGSSNAVQENRISSIATPERGRNRAEVLKTARRMLEAGDDAGFVKNALPISNAEIALLQRNATGIKMGDINVNR